MTELAHLKAIEAELSTSDDSEQTTPVHDRPEVLQALETARTVTRMAIEIEELTASRDSYMRGMEASEQAGVLLRHDLANQTARGDHFERRFNEAKAALEHINQYAERGLYGMRHAGAQPVEISPPDDSDPIPNAGKPWRNLRVLPTAQDITHFAPNRMRR